MSQDAKSRSLWAELGRGMMVVNLVLTCVVVGAQSAAIKLAGLDDALEIGAIIGQTAPLTIATALFVAFLLHQYQQGDFNPWATLLLGAAAYFSATWLANLCGDLRVTAADPRAQAGRGDLLESSARYIVGILLSYYQGYGRVPFLSALAVGTFLGWAWQRVAEHWLASPTPAAPQAETTAPPNATSAPVPSPHTPRRRKPRAAAKGRKATGSSEV